MAGLPILCAAAIRPSCHLALERDKPQDLHEHIEYFAGHGRVSFAGHLSAVAIRLQTSLSSSFDDLRLWMKRGRLPLTALRSFEAAGRLRSFTRAAEELFISQAAVSRQVRSLERLLGQPLFERRHRAVFLTPAGVRLLATLTASFDEIGDLLDAIGGEGEVSEVKVSVEPSFASWLAPKLIDFQRQHPQIDIAVESEVRVIDFRPGEPRIAVRYGATATSWPGTECRKLWDVAMVPVIAPELLTPGMMIGAPRDLLAHGLLHEENRDLWRQWFRAAAIEDAHVLRGPIYADGGLVLQAALAGQGAALVDKALAADEIASGRLVRLFDREIPFGAYWLVARSFRRLSPAAAAFADWLTARCRARVAAVMSAAD